MGFFWEVVRMDIGAPQSRFQIENEIRPFL